MEGKILNIFYIILYYSFYKSYYLKKKYQKLKKNSNNINKINKRYRINYSIDKFIIRKDI